MKKILIAAAVIFSTAVIVYTRDNGVQSATNNLQNTFFNYQKELASGD